MVVPIFIFNFSSYYTKEINVTFFTSFGAKKHEILYNNVRIVLNVLKEMLLICRSLKRFMEYSFGLEPSIVLTLAKVSIESGKYFPMEK